MKLAGDKKKKNPDQIGNHIVICKKVLDILFKVDKMEDYMDYSSASEDDLDYADCEEENDSSTATDHSQKVPE